MPLISDLLEIKKVLGIDPGDRSEDTQLAWYLEWASRIIEDYLNRNLFFKDRTEYYSGTGTQNFLLRSRPVFPNPPAPYTPITIIVDENGFYGSSSGAFVTSPTTQPLVYGQDFTIVVDQDDGSSLSAIVIRISNYWNKPTVRQAGLLSPFLGKAYGNIRVSYCAGYSLDNLPSSIRAAVDILVARIRLLMPLGISIAGESFEERSISYFAPQRNYLTSLVKEFLMPYRNWKW